MAIQSARSHLLGERSRHTVVVTEDEIYGEPYVVLRMGHFIRGGADFWSVLFFKLKMHEVQELQRVLSRILSQEVQENELAPRNRGGDVSPRGGKPSCRMSLQDQVLTGLAGGLDPEEVRAKVFGESSEDRERFVQVGKALRRCGYLPPRSWVPTPEGRDRARSIQGEGSEGGSVIEMTEMEESGAESTPFPGPADILKFL